MFTAEFWLSTTDRAAKSAAQALLLLWGSDVVFDLFSVEPLAAAGVAAGAAVLSVLTSVVSAPFGEHGTPAVVPGAR